MKSQSSHDGHSVAITGLSCRFPGDGDNIDHFWESICLGQSAWSEIPKSRFNVDAFHSTSGKVNTSVTRGAHFLKQDITRFDANFFGLSKAEAGSMDPQHRMMIEVAYEGLEAAGMTLDDVAGSKTGVFIGHFTSDYREMTFRDPESAPMYTFSGTTKTSLANRISWLFDLRGPSFSLDTACSSSLVALHLACQSLRTGDSDIAIVGGVNLLLNPEMFMYLSNQHFLSPDGKCKSFDESGNGYGRGEGIAALVLKRVDDAIIAQDPIRAIIRGTGSNQDGHTKGFTLPSSEAQSRLIRDTYSAAGLDFRDTRYVEAHGTGTQAGDTEETLALSQTISGDHSSENPLYIGSVKSNIGHLEACAGLAGVIKSILVLENGVIPPNIHYKKGNPKIKFDEWGLKVPRDVIPFPASGLRRISINSFGYGGSNAHVILDDAFHYLQNRGISVKQYTENSRHDIENIAFSTSNDRALEDVQTRPRKNGVSEHPTNGEHKGSANGFVTGGVESSNQTYPKKAKAHSNGYMNGFQEPVNGFQDRLSPRIFFFSAHDREGLKRVKRALADHLVAKLEYGSLNSQRYLADLAFTLSRRATLRWRTSIIASSIHELWEKLQSDEETVSTRAGGQPRIGFVFTGQGAQWPMMGIELMVYPAFRASIQSADSYLRSACSCTWSVEEELRKGKSSSRLHLAEFSQTLCTVLQIATADLLRLWKVTPKAVAGHSSGEIAAAYCMGALTQEDAWRAAYYRGVVSTTLKEIAPDISGSMMAVGGSPKQAVVWTSQVQNGEVVLACINSPSSVTLSGDTTGIDEMATKLTEMGIFARKLKVDTAYHSPHMQIVAPDYFDYIADIEPRADAVECRMHSSVTGLQIEANELGAANWVRNLTSPVQFATAIYDMVRPMHKSGERLEENAVDLLIEIGPHSALQGPSTQTLNAHNIKDMQYESVLQRDHSGLQTALNLAGAVFARGGQLNSTAVNNESDQNSIRLLIDLPSYPWNHSQGYWEESRITKEFRNRKQPPLSLLGAPSASFVQGEYMWRKHIRLSEELWISDHQIESSIVYPGAGFLAMAFEAASQIADPHQKVAGFQLRDVQLTAAVVVSEDADVECTVQLRPHFTSTRDLGSTWLEFVVSTSPDTETLQRNCSGLLLIDYESAKNSNVTIEGAKEADFLHHQYLQAAASCKQHVVSEDFYRKLANIGLKYGPVFKNLKDIRYGVGKSFCAVDIPNAGLKSSDRPHVIHPGTLDAMFHSAFAAIQEADGEMTQAMVPRAIEQVFVSANMPYNPETRLSGFSNADKHGFKELKADIFMFADEATNPIVKIIGFTCTEIGSSVSTSEGSMERRNICSKTTWQPAIRLNSATQITPEVKEVEGKDIIERIERDEFTAYTCIGDLIETTPAAHVASKNGFGEWMRAQKQSIESSDHPLKGFAHCERNSVDVDRLEDLSHAMRERLTNEWPKVGGMYTKLRDELFMASESIKSVLRQLSKYLRLLHFTNPQLSILEIQSESMSLLKHLPDIEAVLETAQCTVACPSDESLADSGSGLAHLGKGVEYVVLDSTRSLGIPELQDRKFDVVLASSLEIAPKDFDMVLRNARALLENEGNVCIMEVNRPGLYLSALVESAESRPNSSKSILPHYGLNLHVALNDVDSPYLHQAELLIAQNAAETSFTHENEEIAIIQPMFLSERARAVTHQLCETLAIHSCRTTIFSWGPDISAIKGKSCISLLELEESMLGDLGEQDFETLKFLIAEAQRIFWIVGFDGPSSGMVSGLARVIRNENPGMLFQTAHTNTTTTSSLTGISSAIARIFQSETADNEFKIQDGVVFINRIEEDLVTNKEVQALLPDAPDVVDKVPLGEANGPVKLCIPNPGILDSICFQADNLPLIGLETDQIEIDVKATALNFRDVMVVMGQIPDKLLGFDAAGIVRRVGAGVTKFNVGDAVAMAVSSVQAFYFFFQTTGLRKVSHGAHRTVHRSKADFCALIPEGLSFEQAATIPVVHGTAWYGLVQLARVEKGQSILIHAAAGGVGQAAVQIAQHYQLDIIATVGSEPKRKLLRDTYGLSDDRILSSRDLSFVKAVKRLTHGRGVDVILNSLSGEFLRQTWHCIAPFGTFIEIGIKDILDNTELDMRPFLQGASYTFFNLNQFERDRPDVMAKIIAGTFDFQRRKITRPITPVKIYPISDVENAFRLMQAGKHLGKVVLSFSDKAPIPVTKRGAESFHLRSDAAYAIVGGFGGLGRSISNLLVDHGARKLCFLSRSGGTSNEAQKLIQELRDRGVQVRVYTCDVANPIEASKSISDCLVELGPIRGVLQCAMVLRDVLFMKMSYSEWKQAVKPKVQGTWNIHQNLKDLDFFICLSSFAATFGNRGQSNYSAGGAYQDAMAYHRRSLGLHAVTIDVGIMRDIGVLAEKGVTDSLREWEEPYGILETELHALLKRVITGDIKGDIAPQVLTGFATGGSALAAGISPPFYLNDDARFSIMAGTGIKASQIGSANASQGAAMSTQALLSKAGSLQEAAQVVTDALKARVAKMLQTPESEIDAGRFLHSYGVDSLTAIEIVNWALRELKATVSVIDVMASVPITTTARKIVSSSTLYQVSSN
ncbi:hypothetical protein ACLMJK_003274 [Lecanora helva]